MAEAEGPKNSLGVADWLFKGVLTRVGDSVDRLTGRRWTPSSSLATSELIERIKKLLDAEVVTVAGKGKVVPHNIRLKIQWDKFATDSDSLIEDLRNELLTATIDHINDSNYYTLAPVRFDVATDYFIDGVKLQAGFDRLMDDDREVEMNVTVPAFSIKDSDIPPIISTVAERSLKAIYSTDGKVVEQNAKADNYGRVSIGRSNNNAITIKDPSISNVHATILVSESGELSVADTGSTNGTFVDDERIPYAKVVAVPSGAKLRFGVVSVELEATILQPQSPPEPDVTAADRDSVTINGFEFRSKTSGPVETVSTESNNVTDTKTEADDADGEHTIGETSNKL